MGDSTRGGENGALPVDISGNVMPATMKRSAIAICLRVEIAERGIDESMVTGPAWRLKYP